MDKEVLLLSNIIKNRDDNTFNMFDEENVISHQQTRNAISPWLLNIGKNRIVTHF